MTTDAHARQDSGSPRSVLAPRCDVAADLAGDWRVLLVIGTGLVLQTAHPVIGAGVGEHSTYRSDPFGRARRSIWPVLAMVLLDDGVEDYTAQLREMHRGIKGTDDAGRRYHAWDAEAAFWVLATAVYASEVVADVFGTPLTQAEREALYARWRRAGRDFGIPDGRLPVDHAAYRVWFDGILADRLEDHSTAHDVLAVMKRPPAPRRVPTLVWRVATAPVAATMLLFTIGALPRETRDLLGLRWGRREQRLFNAAARLVRVVNRVLPRGLRQVNRVIVRRERAWMLAHVAHGAELGIAPSLAG